MRLLSLQHVACLPWSPLPVRYWKEAVGGACTAGGENHLVASTRNVITVDNVMAVYNIIKKHIKKTDVVIKEEIKRLSKCLFHLSAKRCHSVSPVDICRSGLKDSLVV